MLKRHKLYFTNKDFLISSLVSFFLLAASFVINFYAGVYATKQASNSVTDIILSNIGPFDVDKFFVYGPVVFYAFILILCFLRPERIPFIGKSIALFILVRSVFITLTHIGPFMTQVPINSMLINKFTFGGDLFFSGHTGLPFLMALLFWENLRLRILFIASSIFFGIVVLMGHIHYSIDVLSAFFITYTIFHIAEFLFKKDRKLFRQGL
jgi:hypothetical protein